MSEVPQEQIFDDDFDQLRRLLGPADKMPANSTEWAFATQYVTRQPEIQQKRDAIRARLNDAQQAVKNVTSELPAEKDPERQSQLAVQALTALGTVDAQVNDLVATAEPNPFEHEGAAPQTSHTPATALTQLGLVGGFISKVKAALGNIQAGLMNFLAKYMKFQSWTVSGQLTGGVPWLSGSVNLALTFGP